VVVVVVGSFSVSVPFASPRLRLLVCPLYRNPQDGYNPDDFELMQRGIEASGGSASFFTPMPPSQLPGYPGKKRKYCLCCGITIGASDQPNLNKGWANATWERKQEIIAEHTYFELGTFFYLANDPKVPAGVRKQFSSYGLCTATSTSFWDHSFGLLGPAYF